MSETRTKSQRRNARLAEKAREKQHARKAAGAEPTHSNLWLYAFVGTLPIKRLYNVYKITA